MQAANYAIHSTDKHVSCAMSGQVYTFTLAYAGVDSPSGPAPTIMTFSSAADVLLCSSLPTLSLFASLNVDGARQVMRVSNELAVHMQPNRGIACLWPKARPPQAMIHGEPIAFPGTAARATQPVVSKAVFSFFKCSSVQAADITVSIQEAQLMVPGSHSSPLIQRLLFCGPSKVADSLHS